MNTQPMTPDEGFRILQQQLTGTGKYNKQKVHFHVSGEILRDYYSHDQQSDRIQVTAITEGFDGMYQLAEDLTEKFIAINAPYDGHDEFFELMRDFLDEELYNIEKQ